MKRKLIYVWKRIAGKVTVYIAVQCLAFMLCAEIQTDKVAHAGIGYALADITYSISKDDTGQGNIPLALLVVGVVATGKELFDSRFDTQDLLYAIGGAGIALTVKITF